MKGTRYFKVKAKTYISNKTTTSELQLHNENDKLWNRHFSKFHKSFVRTREQRRHINPLMPPKVRMVTWPGTSYRRWARRAACRWCPWWWGTAPWGKCCPTSAGRPPATGASWWPHPAARPSGPPSGPPRPWAGWGPAAGLGVRADTWWCYTVMTVKGCGRSYLVYVTWSRLRHLLFTFKWRIKKKLLL